MGETSSTAYRGDRGKTAYDHSQATGNAHGTTASQIPNTPAGTIAATTVQAAINELDGDVAQVRADLNKKAAKTYYPYKSYDVESRVVPFNCIIKDAIVFNAKADKYYSITTFTSPSDKTSIRIICHECSNSDGTGATVIINTVYFKPNDYGVKLIKGNLTGTDMYLLFDIDAAWRYFVAGVGSISGNWPNLYPLNENVLNGLGNGLISSILKSYNEAEIIKVNPVEYNQLIMDDGCIPTTFKNVINNGQKFIKCTDTHNNYRASAEAN